MTNRTTASVPSASDIAELYVYTTTEEDGRNVDMTIFDESQNLLASESFNCDAKDDWSDRDTRREDRILKKMLKEIKQSEDKIVKRMFNNEIV